ncbi:Uncharacterised protein [Mycolicibacterium vanbaalenii]|uniref:Uncharacterized protein n=1 Tax=Mycolicibacterium vanbaalenii TaxID=110539 RepID=A0A5S9MMY0_MYCVN|nr:hypothetical protein [Mycolicibacterium vanbaalenii]CAA0078275.1 Uncharacterised protein [Mycolicibacterium vanbaalenii]
MSDAGRGPNTPAELIRSFDKRLRALERKQTQRVGGYVMGSDPAGRVVLTNTDGREVVLTPDPVADPEITGTPQVSGTTLRVFRATTDEIAIPAAATPTAYPDGLFDTVHWISNDLADRFDMATGALTVGSEGPYLVEHRIQVDTNINTNNVTPLILVNGAEFTRGKQMFGSTNDNSNNWADLRVVRCVPDDVLQVGRLMTFSRDAVGDEAGVLTYLSIVKLA